MEQKTYDETMAVREVLSLIDTPRALSVWLLYSYGIKGDTTLEHDQLLSLEPSWPTRPGCTLGEEAILVAKDLQATKLLQKVSNLNTSFNRVYNALEQFLRAEEAAHVTNRKFRAPSGFSSMVEACLMHAIRDIADILPVAPSVAECFNAGSLGPGGSSFVDKKEACCAAKLNEFACSKFLYDEGTVRDFWMHNELFTGSYKIIESDRIQCVPKNGKTDRTIGVGPSANMVAQKGAASYVRKALYLWGIDIKDQTKNQLAAQKGRVTVDLKNGSANVSTGLAGVLLPLEWSELLFKLRMSSWEYEHAFGDEDSPQTELFTGVYGQLSGMGNGYTFEVETLIFAAIARSCVRLAGGNPGDVLCYGDDIILPNDESYEVFRSVSEEIGFVVNEAKTFSGMMPYRESCGKHYYGGYDVSYETIKGDFGSNPHQAAFLCHNIVLSYGLRCGARLGDINATRARIIRDSEVVIYCRPSAGLLSGFWLTGLAELREFDYLPASSFKDRKSGLYRRRKGVLTQGQIPLVQGTFSERKYSVYASKPNIVENTRFPTRKSKPGKVTQVGLYMSCLLPNKLNPYTTIESHKDEIEVRAGTARDVVLPGVYAWAFKSIIGPGFHDSELDFILRNVSEELILGHLFPPTRSRKSFN